MFQFCNNKFHFKFIDFKKLNKYSQMFKELFKNKLKRNKLINKKLKYIELSAKYPDI